jgi:hypothetical protein
MLVTNDHTQVDLVVSFLCDSIKQKKLVAHLKYHIR